MGIYICYHNGITTFYECTSCAFYYYRENQYIPYAQFLSGRLQVSIKRGPGKKYSYEQKKFLGEIKFIYLLRHAFRMHHHTCSYILNLYLAINSK